MSRKERKQKRKRKQQPKQSDQFTKKEVREITKFLTAYKKEYYPTDRSMHGKIFNDNGKLGCYDYQGGKAYCKDCRYKDYCLKREV